MGTPFTATAQPFTVTAGSTGPADLLYDGYPALTDTVTAIHRTDWEGRQLLYPTARTNNIPNTESPLFGFSLFSGATATAGQPDPAGTTKAVQLVTTTTMNSGVNCGPSLPEYASKYPQSVWLKGSVGGELIQFGDATNRTLVTLTTSWALYETSVIPASGYFIVYSQEGYAETFYFAFPSYFNTAGSASSGGAYIPTSGTPVTVTDYVDNGNGTISLGVAATAQDVYDWDGTGEYYIPAFGYFRPAYKRRDPPLSGAARQTEVRVQAKSLLTDGQYVSGRDRAKLRTRR